MRTANDLATAARALLELSAITCVVIVAAVVLSVSLGLQGQALAEPEEPQANGLDLTVTVGINPAACAVTKVITLPVGGGTPVYCYTAHNYGGIPLNFHTLVDSRQGVLLSDFPYELGPGASAFLTSTAFLTASAVSSATWTADASPVDLIAQDTDVVTVTVTAASPAIRLVKTVGTNPSVCASTSSIVLAGPGGQVYYCYTVTNSGNITMVTHTLVDDRLGLILSNFPYALAPGAGAFLTQTAFVTTTTTNHAAWTAYSAAQTYSDTGQSTALVTVRRLLYLPMVKRQ